MGLTNTGVGTGSRGYRVCVTKNYPKAVELPEIEKMVRQWAREFGSPPSECFLNSTVINDRIVDRLHELGVTTIDSTEGILAWEVYIGPAHL